MSSPKRTPCVGICSTTYGDLVCRGCKRFAHEIVQWNGYDQAQQARIWSRLHGLRDEVVSQSVVVAENATYQTLIQTQAKLAAFDGAEQLYEVVRHLAVAAKALTDAGLTTPSGTLDALVVLKTIDAEIFARSQAHYERNFKVPV